MKINCIAIDDEPLALGLIKSFIQQTSFLNLIGWYSSSGEALHYLRFQSVDLIFLDIRMPKINGIDLAKILHQKDPKNSPRIIFISAHDQFAIESYRVDALDYLLKPFGYNEFLRASNKAFDYYQRKEENRKQREEIEHLFVRVGHQLVRISWEEILYIEGMKDYVMIHLIGSSSPVVALATLKSLEGRLPSEYFMRIQRSFIVALNKIRIISKSSIWIGEVEISIGEQYKAAVMGIFNRDL